MKIEAVTFDVGGTLLEPWPSVGHVYADVAANHGFPDLPVEIITSQFAAAWKQKQHFDYSRPAWAQLVDASFAGLIPVPPSGTFFDALYHRFTEASAWRIYDDVFPTLKALSGLSLKLGIISNWDERLEPLLAATGLAQHFDVITFSHAVGCCKPSSQIFTNALAALKLPADRVLHVGDSVREDVEGAAAVGTRGVLLDRNSKSPDSSVIGDLGNLLTRLD